MISKVVRAPAISPAPLQVTPCLSQAQTAIPLNDTRKEEWIRMLETQHSPPAPSQHGPATYAICQHNARMAEGFYPWMSG